MPSHEEYCSRVKDLLGFDLLGVLGRSGLPELTAFLRYLASADLLTWEMFRTICTMLGKAKEVWALLPENDRVPYTGAIWATARNGAEYEAWIYAVSLMTMKNTLTAFRKDPAIYSRMNEVKAIVNSETERQNHRYAPARCAKLFGEFFSNPNHANRAISHVGLKAFSFSLYGIPAGLWAPRLASVLSANARDELASLMRSQENRPDSLQRASSIDALFHAFYAQLAKDDKPTLAVACQSLYALPDPAFAECVTAFGPVILANLLKEDPSCRRSWARQSPRLPETVCATIDGVMAYDFKIRRIQAEAEVRRLRGCVAIQRALTDC